MHFVQMCLVSIETNGQGVLYAKACWIIDIRWKTTEDPRIVNDDVTCHNVSAILIRPATSVRQ